MSTTTVARTKTPMWAKTLLIVLILLLIVAAGFGGVMLGKILGASEERSTQVIRSITREEQIILATAGMTDVKPTSDDLNFFGLDIPFTDRTVLMRYEYDAKFGIEGGDVSIEPIGDNKYRVSIPQFVFLGYDNPDFSIADEKNGILSWATPEIDKNELVKSLLTDQAVAEHLEGLRPVLEEQAKSFYTNIITAIEPDATVQFTFANGKDPA